MCTRNRVHPLFDLDCDLGLHPSLMHLAPFQLVKKTFRKVDPESIPASLLEIFGGGVQSCEEVSVLYCGDPDRKDNVLMNFQAEKPSKAWLQLRGVGDVLSCNNRKLRRAAQYDGVRSKDDEITNRGSVLETCVEPNR